ncbi:Crp/Fnr family transcriptional regulator [Actinokineospora diospyrosa]|uniref:cAMP-binding domain of CRP or a regulatory subunit of cAMP-dependent protein kinases n=1 Tax=Actinokineospora diospyrosa TaxID=103728 RepID=A0ABT1IA43_9PSEU|nr:Crp/Fnr family transcriptional regulator [Actinokineospora diospyrosa]MCP2269499.1 cAMP-binding domain of CRP or a regulatory subunit of cAMP-dependent protein kinases [Actinokineospora diospyrosa]
MQTFRTLVGARVWAAVVAAGTAREYARGEVLLRQGEPGGYALALVRGRVRVVLADGLLVSLRSAGDLVGELAAAGVGRTASVVALDRCTACHVSARVLDAVAGGAVGEYLRQKLVATVEQVSLARLGSRTRVARLLLAVVDLGEAGDRRVPLSQEAVARALGMARSTVAEHIADLRRHGALRDGPRLVVADRDLLAAHAV